MRYPVKTTFTNISGNLLINILMFALFVATATLSFHAETASNELGASGQVETNEYNNTHLYQRRV
jgi:hypothetical protein